MIPNLTGLNSSEKIEIIRKAVNTLIQFKNELPVGMTVLRRDEKDNTRYASHHRVDIIDCKLF